MRSSLQTSQASVLPHGRSSRQYTRTLHCRQSHLRHSRPRIHGLSEISRCKNSHWTQSRSAALSWWITRCRRIHDPQPSVKEPARQVLPEQSSHGTFPPRRQGPARLTSWGEGPAAIEKSGDVNTTLSTVFAVGPLKSYPSPGSPGYEYFGFYYFGDPSPSVTQLGPQNLKAFEKMSEFFQDPPSPENPYRVSVGCATPARGHCAQAGRCPLVHLRVRC